MGLCESKSIEVPHGTVLMHTGMKRGPNAPSFIPYALKLETYLRIAKIPYQCTEKGCMGPKNKVPWIELNNEKMGDSYFIMKHLNKQFNVNLDQNLSAEEKAMSTSLRIMTEEFLQYSISMELILWNDKETIKKMMGVPSPLVWVFKAKVQDDTKKQGIGNHTREEIYRLTEEQLSAISTTLGDKPYMFGKEASEIDCTMMGILGQIKWHMSGSYHHSLIQEKFPNINDYLERMKTTFYPDWDELIASDQTDKTEKTDHTSKITVDTKNIPIHVK